MLLFIILVLFTPDIILTKLTQNKLNVFAHQYFWFTEMLYLVYLSISKKKILPVLMHKNYILALKKIIS